MEPEGRALNWDHIAKPISTADGAAATPTIFQSFEISSGYRNQIVKAIVAGLFFYGNPAFGNVRLEIWSDDNGVPGRLLQQSGSFTQAECNTNTFAYRIMEFSFAGLAIKKNSFYHLAVRLSAYTGNANSHVAWRQSWPDPQYSTGITLTLENGLHFPYEAMFLTADL